MNRIFKFIALWVPALLAIEFAWLAINTAEPSTRNQWGIAAVGAVLFGIACQEINRHASKETK